jgi:hypothetical protein
MISGERNDTRRDWALGRGAQAFLYKPFNAFDIDRELHALFGLRMPQLAGVDPLKAARKLAASDAVDELQWKRAGG